jgi:hypothetical protein
MTTLTEPIYASVEELQAELADGPVPDGAAATRVIQDAEDVIDRFLGGARWWPEETTGRKVVQANVLPWQWAKLTRATVKLAARLYRDSTLLTEQAFETIRGPDFSATKPSGGAAVRLLGIQVLALLDDSGLRQLAGRARQGGRRRGMRPDYERFLYINTPWWRGP